MDQKSLDALTFYADPKSYSSGHNGPDVMREGWVRAKEALALAKQGDGPCTGGCLLKSDWFCVRCGLQFSSEAEWRARAQHDAVAVDLPKEQQ